MVKNEENIKIQDKTKRLLNNRSVAELEAWESQQCCNCTYIQHTYTFTHTFIHVGKKDRVFWWVTQGGFKQIRKRGILWNYCPSFSRHQLHLRYFMMHYRISFHSSSLHCTFTIQYIQSFKLRIFHRKLILLLKT